jgi:hypothetical protein
MLAKFISKGMNGSLHNQKSVENCEMSTTASFTITYVDNQLAAYLNGLQVWISANHAGGIDETYQLTTGLIPGASNQLLFVGANNGGPAKFQGTVTVNGKVLDPKIDYDNSDAGEIIVFSQSYTIQG